MNNLLKINAVAMTTILFASAGWAGTVGNMNTFTANTTAKASEVNANFAEHTTQINDNTTSISGNASAIEGKMSAGTDNWVNITGDRMTGNLVVSGNVGVGNFRKGVPTEKLEVIGNATVTGNLTVAGTLKATIDVAQITGLLGSGFTLQFPDVLNNTATLEMSGLFSGDVVVITGPGYDIERLSGFDLIGRPKDMPGFAQEHPFVFETTTVDDATAVKAYFDQPFVDPRDLSLLIQERSGFEVFRWNMLRFKADGYVPGVDGRTRFTMVESSLPNSIAEIDIAGVAGTDDPFGLEASNNMATDTLVEISGITAADFYPQVEIDEAQRTMTLTYDIVEGAGIFPWVKTFVQGLADIRSGSVIQLDGAGVEISRQNYFGLFPIKYEQHTGYGDFNRIKARVVISFDYSAAALR